MDNPQTAADVRSDAKAERGPDGVDARPAVPDIPPRMIMDLRTDCNLKCPMCIVHGDPENPKLKDFLRRDTDIEKVRRVLDEIMAVKPLMMPSLWSEPLLAKHFMDYVRAVKGRGLALAMNTNGLTFRRPMAEIFAEIAVDAVCFSIDATTKETLKKVRGVDKLEKIHRAVELMLDVRGDRNFPRVGTSFVVQEANAHEEAAFVERWAHKVDFVRTSVLFKDGGFPTINLTKDRKPCSALYSTMAIHANGNASYCCLDGFGETNVGNVFEEGVRAVWHGAKLNEVRHYHETGQWDKVPFCKKCDRWASYDYEELIKDGLLIRKSPEYTYYNRIDRLGNWNGNLVAHHPDPQESLRRLTGSDTQ